MLDFTNTVWYPVCRKEADEFAYSFPQNRMVFDCTGCAVCACFCLLPGFRLSPHLLRQLLSDLYADPYVDACAAFVRRVHSLYAGLPCGTVVCLLHAGYTGRQNDAKYAGRFENQIAELNRSVFEEQSAVGGLCRHVPRFPGFFIPIYKK